MKLNFDYFSRPSPRFSLEVVQNRELISDVRILPEKYAKLTNSQEWVLARLYAADLKHKTAGLAELGTTHAVLDKLEQLRILTVLGQLRSRARITQYGRRWYEVLYWHHHAVLEDRQGRQRAAVFGKRGKGT